MGGHADPEVTIDLEGYWPILRPGGVMIGDDYNAEAWPGVVSAANRFAAANGIEIEDAKMKFVLRKTV